MQRSRYRDAIRANYAELLFTCAAFIALGAVCCWYLSGMMRKQMDLYSESVMTVSQAHLQALINADEMALHDSAVTVVEALNYGVPREKLKDVFTELSNNFLEQRNVKELFAAVYGSIDGQFIVGGDWIPPEGYDPAQRPWYVGAVRYKGLAYSSEPYKDLITGEMACSVSKVLFDKDGVDRGVLSVSFLLDPVLKLVQSISFAEEGYGVLFDRSLRVISHPDKSFIGRHMTDIPSYEKIRENLAMNIFGTQLQITDYTGEDCLAFFSRLRNGWYIGLIVPYDRYYSDIYSMIPTISATGLVFMVMLCFILINLSIAKMRSDEENRSKSSFLASMSHEIRTPMNAIIGMADLMRTDNLDETQREYLVDIKKTSGALLNIINDILDFSKIEAGKMALVQTHYNLFTLFDNIRSIAEFFTAEKALRLECDIDETLPRVLYGDEGRVRQIIMNLVSNAVKYTHKGQVSLRLRRTTKNERDYLAVSVEDTGIGIKKEDFPRLFESFEQVDKDKNRGITGTGLGLPITKRLADLMGGEIFFESEYGRGSVFTVLLPLEEGDPFKADILKRRTRCSVSQDARILVVDDNALNLTVAQGFLARHGVRAETAVSGEEAIEKIYTARYDLVFMDHMMPGMDGIETVHRIRALPGAYYADLPIVALSA
ncbi:MAG: response regulator, partial [Desulfovibrio sp.]|nr:response regulator [Desulfovibrio sp.]